MANPLLIDIGPLSCGCTDHALETIYKAQRLDDGSLWAPHHDPFVRDHIEAVTTRGIGLLDTILEALQIFLGIGKLAKADTLTRWNVAKLSEVRERLEQKPREQYTIEDWMLLVDWLVHRYLPAEVILTESEYLAVRAVAAGKIQAATEGRGLSDAVKAGLVGAAPESMAGLERFGKPSNLESVVLTFSRARAAELITDIGDRARHRIKSLILAHEENIAIGSPDASVASLQNQLFEEFAVLNRDWRRIAITETARNANEGFLAALPVGSRVRRIEAYATACAFCRSIHDKTFTVVGPAKEGKDGWTEVWVGKTNVGRSAAPRRRVGGELVERTDAELWWPAAGTQHPNCRGTWVREAGTAPGVDPKFAAWLKEQLDNA